MSKLKEFSNNTAKCTLNFISSDIKTAHSAGSIPRGRQQVDDIRKKMPSSSNALFTLYDDVLKAQNNLMLLLGLYLVILAFDWTLDDLVKLCTPSTSFIYSGY